MNASALVPKTPATVSAATLVSDFLSRRKQTTIRAYAADLRDFAAFVGAPSAESAVAALLALDPGNANAAARAYRNGLLARKLSPATINRRLAALRSVVSLAQNYGIVAWSLKVEGERSEAYRDTRGPGRKGFLCLLEAAGTDSARDLRNRAIVRLLYDLALRRGEVTALDLADVDLAAGSLDVLGKGRTERQRLTLPAQTIEALRLWIEARGAEAGPLFRNVDRAGKGERLTGRSVARIVAELGTNAGIGKVRPHGLRHAAVTEALDLTNGNVRAVQRFSRHRSLAVLNRYDDNREDLGGEIARLVAAGAAL